MYTPASFAENNLATIHDFIDAHSFGILVNQAQTLHASHLPFLLDRQSGEQGMLIGHMARANYQWRDLDQQSVLVVFHGPHAYVSPAWYDVKNSVPTWNYVAVHVTGTSRIVTSRARLLEIVAQTVTKHESERQHPWTLDEADPSFIDGLLDAIVGFEIPIEQVEGKWKLNQNHDAERQRRAALGLRHEADDNARAIAELMEAHLDRIANENRAECGDD